ncbi:hypothetical protein D9X91_16305 [Falsibacillus albus]|uniref:Uncharacterized protein n=1 Tax=Falsibacillus albus TaxID=2478915 RepID=A0A3L7JVZ3_9BACI|nr:hypothetical protein D9X91_16305 [Falsibacillus albus]
MTEWNYDLEPLRQVRPRSGNHPYTTFVQKQQTLRIERFKKNLVQNIFRFIFFDKHRQGYRAILLQSAKKQMEPLLSPHLTSVFVGIFVVLNIKKSGKK